MLGCRLHTMCYVAIVTTLVWVTVCSAEFKTVAGSDALRINFCAFDIGRDYESADSLFAECSMNTDEGVRTRALWDYSSEASPLWPLPDMLSWLDMPSDVVLLSSHGAQWEGLAMEAYDDIDNRDAVFDNYIDQGTYGYDEIGTKGVASANSPTGFFYFITAKPSLLEQHSPCNARSIIMVAASNSDSFHDVWGAGAHIGYDYSPQSDHAKEHISRVFCRLRGLGGRTTRSSGEVINGLPVTQRGRTDLVINPAVEEMYPSHHTVLDGEFTGGYVQFDTALTTEGSRSS